MKLGPLEIRRRRPPEQKASRTAVLFAGASGESAATYRKARRYDKLAEEGYVVNVVASRCIDEIARSVSSVPWQLFRTTNAKPKSIERKIADVEGRQIADDHPVASLIWRANPYESWERVMLRADAFFCLSGNAFVERVMVGEDTPQEVYAHRPERVTIKLNETSGVPAKFVYTVGSKEKTFPIDPVTGRSDMLHIKTFHPLDDLYGFATIESAACEIDIYNQGAKWNQRLLQRDARPGMVYTLIGQVSDEQFSDLERQINAKYAGAENSGRSIVITGEQGTKAEPYQLTPMEMDWRESMLAVARHICMAFGVPPMLIGIPGESTFANYREARLAFWESVVLWHLNMFRAELNTWFFPEEDDPHFLDYVLDEVPAMEFRREKLFERLQAVDFLTLNEKRAMIGKPEMEGGDVILVPGTHVPLSDMGAQMNDEAAAE